MSRPSWLHKIYWSHFAKPVEERALFAQLISRPIASVLEIGVGSGQRMRRIAKLVRLRNESDTLRYIGTDEFESAQDGKRHLSLKQAHQITGLLRFKASLIPGNVASALPRVAHKMGTSDLIIADGGLDPRRPREGIIGSWLDRLAHEETIILACPETGGELVKVDNQLLRQPESVAINKAA